MSQLACFGFITCFDGNSDTCQSCDKAKSCQKACYKQLSGLDIGQETVKKLMRKHERWARKLGNEILSSTKLRERFKTDSDEAIKGLDGMALTIAKSILHNNVDLKSAKNATTIQPDYLAVMVKHLHKPVLSTRSLTNELKSYLGWTENTAKRYAVAFVSLMNHWRLVNRVKRGEYERV